METKITFRPLSWEDLQAFLRRESRKVNHDVDKEVRYMTYTLFCEQCVEGLYLDGTLVGFARWDRQTNHLSNLYVIKEARGCGVGRQFISERPIRTLYVMPRNERAKQLYRQLGFREQQCAVPTRELMVR